MQKLSFTGNIHAFAKPINLKDCREGRILFKKVLRWVVEKFAFNLKIIVTEDRLLTQQEISMKIGKLGK